MGTHRDNKEPLRRGEVLRDSYRIDRVLGSGGFAITYLACHIGLDHQVAIKEYLPADAGRRAADGKTVLARPGAEEDFEAGLARFTDEARALASFSHRSIVSVADIFECNGTAYMAMEYIDGESLATLLKRIGTVEEERLRAILEPVLDALDALHVRGVLHRDIKPENIQIRSNGCPVLIDLGNSRSMAEQFDEDLPIMLTPGYAPIEQYMATGGEGPWTDIYALAATLYRAVTGDAPCDAKARIIEDACVPVREAVTGDYSASLLSAINRALSVRPGHRPQCIAEFRALLNAPTGVGNTIVPTRWIRNVPSSASDHGNRKNPPNRARVAFVTALFAAMTVGAAYLDWSGRRQAESVSVAAELSRIAVERAQRDSAKRREVARWERAEESVANALAQRRASELARRRAAEAARRDASEAKRQRSEAAERRRAAEAKPIRTGRITRRRLAEKRSGNDNNPLSGIRRLFLGTLPR